MTRLPLLAAVLAISVNVIAAQPSASVRVTGPRTVTFSVADLAALPRTAVTATAHERQATYEGVSIRELLSRVGMPSGDGLADANWPARSW